MSPNLNNLIEEKIKALDKFMGVPPEVYEQWANDTCPICGQPCDKSKQYQELKEIFYQSITEAVEKTLEAVELEQRETDPEKAMGDYAKFARMIDNAESFKNNAIGYNEAISEFKKLKSNWLK